MSFLPKTPLNPEYFNLVLPGITSKSRRSVDKLLKNNHDQHHAFFNEKKFHNHLTHHLLAAYSFGANEKRLEEIYERHASYQRPLPPALDNPLTRENYHGQLGKASAYTSFLRLFEKEIDEHGILDTVRRWIWSGDMLSRFVGGAYHPLIHVGYGVEFGLKGQVAEGLAMAACTENRFSPWISDSPALRDTVPTIPAISTAPLQQREEKGDNNKTSIRQDSFFDAVLSANDENRLSKIFSQPRAVDRINDYRNQWKHARAWATREDLNARVKELFSTAVVCHGATGFPAAKEDEHAQGGVKIDFFMMHALTSSYFIQILVPHLLAEEAASLMQAHLFSTLVHFVMVGRPEVKIDRLLEYVSPNFKSISPEQPHKHWAHLLDATVDEEEHVIKAIRACAQAQILYNDDPDWFDDALYLKAAELTYDLHGNWTFGVGFV
ncbi:hypothetical protein BCR42DRAFT_423306 [Absidia repens]|uniref:Oxidoreductase AflY n=1 Tax=Absidia repens TaxID=90262 RepID=A0A1X2I5P8_9FUNG|nr:hypothetical protein BCR42DRAFT_423306 [Absidia repens]